MEAGLVNRFIQSAQEVLQAEVGGAAKMGRITVQSVPYTSQHVTVLVGIAGTLRGVMLLGLSEETAKRLVSGMMGEEIEELDDMAQSGVAEMGNVIAGSAVTGLFDDGHICKIATPTLIIGSGTTISTLNVRRLVIPLETGCGMIEMQLALAVDEAELARSGNSATAVRV